MNQWKYKQLIPERINRELPEIIKELTSRIKGFSVDNLKQIISILACRTRKDEEAAPLKMEYIKQQVPQGDKYLHGLIDLGIVNRSGSYTPGIRCYEYSFSEKYSSKYESSPLTNPKLIRRIQKVQKEFRKKATSTVRKNSEQIQYLQNLTIDPECYSFNEENHSGDVNTYNYNLGSATRIDNGEIYYSIDSTSERFHSNVTNLSKDLRPFLRVNDEPLINLDIRNSQPYLSTIVLTNPGKVAEFAKNHKLKKLLRTLNVPQNRDVKEYVDLVVSGKLYEFFMDKFRESGFDLDRDQTKKQICIMLFSGNWMPKNRIKRCCKEIFIDCFPTVHKIFEHLRGWEKGKDRFVNYKRFSILLQKIESHLILNLILKRVRREHPGVVVLTIHDCLMVGKKSNSEIENIHRIMIEESTSFFGYPPIIEINN